MILTLVFEQARALLHVVPDAPASAVRAAYRRAVIESPPDKAPELFQRIREAYELLSHPLERVRQILFHPVPLVPPPPVPDAPAFSGSDALPVDVLRVIVGSLPRSEFNVEQGTRNPKGS